MVKLFQNFLKGNKITHIALKTLLSHNVYRKKYTFLKQSQTWDKKQTEEYQIKQLKNLLHHAYKNVPYYNKLFKKAGLKPRDVSSIDDLKKLPFLTKQIVQENREDLKAQNYPEYKFDYIKTGGSTGFPLGVYMEKGVAQATYLAFFQTLLDQANCHLMDKQVSLTGFDSVFKYQIFRRVLALSSFHTKDEDLSLYAKKIRKFKPKFILAYPSAIVTLAKFMNKNKISFPPSIKMVICSGETLFDWQRELLEKTFNCRVYALYAHTEVSVFATTCRYSYNYHVYPEYGITEIVHKDGTPVNKEGEIGEIVTTGFNNFIFPFIRYRTGDLGVVTYQKCRCGRDYMLLKNIIGRVQ
ncbi:MAG: phenylacetate--CoA ligase family protein, partial [Thermoplasmata archaeon]